MKHFAILFFLQFGILQAQDLQIRGKVFDKTDNQPLNGAFITLKNTNKIIASSEKGDFAFINLKPGIYSISVSSMGFETYEKTISIPLSKDSLTICSLKPAIEDMESIVVTATRSEKKLKDVPVLTQVIVPEKLKEIGITTVQAALEHEVPGLDFNTAQNSNRPSITFQGMDGKYILILIDGERIAGEMNGSIDFTRFNLSNVDRIEVVRGASSALYGSNAIGGVINIVTKSPGIPLQVDAFLRYSKYNTISTGASASIKREKIASITNIVYNQSDGYDLNPKAFPTSTAWTQEPFMNGTVIQRIEFYPFKKLTIISNGGVYYNQIFNGRILPNDQGSFAINGYLKAVYKFNDTNILALSYDIDNYSNYNVYVNSNLTRTAFDNLKSAKIVSNFVFAKGIYTLGIEYLPEKLFSIRIKDQIKTGSEINSFLQTEYKITQNISAVLGLRATRHSAYGLNVTPKIALMAKHNNLTFRTSYGLGYRSPTLKDLYYYFDHLGMFTLYGNPNLKPEKSHYIGFSIEMNQNWMSHSVNLYYNKISNLITNKWIDAKNIIYVNDSSARIMGIDLMEKVMPFKNLIIGGGGSYVNAINAISGKQLSDITPLSANVMASYTFYSFHEKTNLEINGKYNGHRQYEPIDNFPLSDNPFNIWRANITQHFKNLMSLTVGIDNIFNTVNSKSFDNISPGRVFYFSLNFKLSKY